MRLFSAFERPQPASVAADDTRISSAWLLFATLGNMLAALVVAGILAGHAGLPLDGWLLGVALVAALPSLAPLLRGQVASRWPELAAALLAVLAIGGAGLYAAWPSLLPMGISVDAAHHMQLIDWLVTHRALPPITNATRGLLGEMSAYPAGFALLVLAAARATGRPALETMYPCAVIVGGLVAGVVVVLAAGPAAATQSRWWRALLLLTGPLFLLSHATFFMDAYLDQSYYTMLFGVLLTLLAFGHALALPSRPLAAAAQLGLTLAALASTYPLWVPLPATLALWLLARRWRSTQTIWQAALVFGPPVLMGLLDVLPRSRAGQAVLAHQGLVALPTLARLAPILLALLGGVVLLAARRSRGLLGAAGVVLLAMLALAVLASTGRVANYHAYKLLFVLTPLACAIVSSAALALAERPRWEWLAGGAALGVALASGLATQSPPRIQLVSPDLVAAARWLRAEQAEAAARAPVLGTSLAPLAYWVQIGLLGQRRDSAPIAQRDLTAPLPPAESWLIDTEQPSVALLARADARLPGVRTLAQFGDVRVVRRDKPLDVAALNPLVLRYRSFWEDARLKTAIEIQHPVAGALPELEIALEADGAAVNRFVLAPDPQRTRPQYLGVDLLPATLGGEGYVNTSDFPRFPGPAAPPAGNYTLKLRLVLAGQSVDERVLATFARAGDGQIGALAPSSGEFVYLRHLPNTAALHGSTNDFGGGLLLTGWNEPARAAAGAPLTIDLRWQAGAQIAQAFFPELQLIDSNGNVLASETSAPQGGFYPTWLWRAGESVDEQRTLALPPNLPHGDYRLRLLVHDYVAQRVLGPVELGPVTVAAHP